MAQFTSNLIINIFRYAAEVRFVSTNLLSLSSSAFCWHLWKNWEGHDKTSPCVRRRVRAVCFEMGFRSRYLFCERMSVWVQAAQSSSYFSPLVASSRNWKQHQQLHQQDLRCVSGNATLFRQFDQGILINTSCLILIDTCFLSNVGHPLS